ncbi:MAG TPA: DUF6331 family protein [Chitinophagaceae bacterium]|nr:DUF6331 family protein [Chitinophagaceae bacterium]
MDHRNDISIVKEKWIEWIDFPPSFEPFDIDYLLEPIDELWAKLETECVSACCGIDAFGLWPEDIAKAVETMDKAALIHDLKNIKKELTFKNEAVILISGRLNNLFDKMVFLQLVDHLIEQIEISIQK